MNQYILQILKKGLIIGGKLSYQKIGEGTVNAFLEDPEKATNLFSLLVNAIQGIKNKMERG